ncbi:MAG: 4Fe-4S dicluster domain-containing protein [Eubacterium sp.]|nr:4Fe-4S dicluster domain-containing protein [Eubacterium sp.]MBQ9022839.1 4Fe-4S dicluster domain-containing protein [Eubacterium sp.]
MNVSLDILRMDREKRIPYHQIIPFETEDERETVATALTAINADPDVSDNTGKPVEPIVWECSCLQKKCGACAMRINGRPALACDAKLRDLTDGKNAVITLEPLRKFPVVADLMVDRSIMYENLKQIGVWLRDEANLTQEKYDLAYEGSRCLQCGCCLEICPNFYAGGTFAGTAGFVPTVRLISELTGKERREVKRAYRRYIYNGCGKSLACRDICPAGIDIEHLLVNSNAIAVWKKN